MTCVSEPFEPEDLAGQIQYLVENQDVYLVESIIAVSPERLYMKLHSGDIYEIVIRKLNPGTPAERERSRATARAVLSIFSEKTTRED